MKLNLIFLLLLVISVLVLTADFGIDNDLKIPLAWENIVGIAQVDDLKGKEVYLEIKLLASPSFNSNLKFTCDLRSYRFDFDFFKWIDNKLGISDE